MKREIHIPLKDIKQLRIDTSEYIGHHSYTLNRIAFQYTIYKNKNKEISRYHLFDKYTLKHLESYDTTRFYKGGNIGGFSANIEDTTRTQTNKVTQKDFEFTDVKIFELVKKHKS